MASHPVIVYAKRTPIGKLLGSLAALPAPRLGAALVADAKQALGLDGTEVDECIMGQVLQAGCGQAPARQAVIYGGLPPSVCASTLNRVCGSGLKSVMLADMALRTGNASIVFAGGQENMSAAPHLLPGARQGYRFGAAEVKDHMQWDGLWDPYRNVAMGNCGEECAKRFSFSRAQQDEFARESYTRARNASNNGRFAKEIVPVAITEKKQTKTIDKDEEPFSVELDRLATLRPAFAADGTITAGNASSINDGAALVVVTSEETAKAKGWQPLARIVAQDSFAQDPTWFTTSPIMSIQRLLKKANLQTKDIDFFEINEAFAVVTMAAIAELKLDPARVNPNGGAVALGHPIGASGTRILVTLLHEMQQKRAKRGVASICIGGGEASSVLVEAIL